MKKAIMSFLCLFIGLVAVFSEGLAVTPEQLQTMIFEDDKVTVIDIRNRWEYAKGHIPNAINIPARIVAKKRLPPLGRVIVCGDGIRPDITREAVEALNQKRGVRADVLEGGYPAWESLNFTTTRQKGFKKETPRFISYEDFQKAAAENPDLVLIDLRSGSLHRSGSASGELDTEAERITDLSQKFPRADLVRLRGKEPSSDKKPGHSLDRLLRGKGTHHDHLYVLIDDGDGSAEEVAHRLKSAGVRRVVILAGGEQALRTEGRADRKVRKSR
jgi:rhodanese-related sulfurtransferase